MNGIELIAEERLRQVAQEGWTAQHDEEHDQFQLSAAAVCYAEFALRAGPLRLQAQKIPFDWPWGEEWWKPSPDRVRNLVKAGALIAAEIDRLQRLQQQGQSATAN
jgi:hypothetical protein